MSIIQRPVDRVQSRTSAYDRLSAALVALIMLIGFLVATLFLIWLTTVFHFDNKVAVPFNQENPGDDGNDKPEGFEDDELDPGVEDFPDIETPALAEALEAVTNAVSSIQANSEHVSGDSAVMGKGGGYGSREGGKAGSGEGIPDYKRWKINYEVDDISEYRELLDAFGIEIGVVALSPQDIWRISDVSGRVNVTPSNRDNEAKTLQFSHVKPRLKRWDIQIAKAAGAPADSSVAMVQFYPQATRSLIASIENDFLVSSNRELKDVRRTNIKVEQDGGEFKFTVLNCEYK
jgi:hypothetical protein